MEMPCNECGGKSPMGSIFCRDCGAKLELDAMEPKVVVKSTGGGFKMSKFAIRRLISLCISIIIFGSLAMLFINDAPELPTEPDNVDKQVKFVDTFYNKALATSTLRRIKTFTVKEDVLTYYMQKQLDEMQKEQEGDALVYNNCIFEFYDDNMIKIDLQATMKAVGITKEISMQMVVSFENTDSGVTFNIESAKHGKIPVPGFAREKLVTSRYERLIPANDDLNAMIEKIKSLEMTDESSLKITLK